MNFGLVLTNLEPFIGWVPEKAKMIIMNMGHYVLKGIMF